MKLLPLPSNHMIGEGNGNQLRTETEAIRLPSHSPTPSMPLSQLSVTSSELGRWKGEIA